MAETNVNHLRKDQGLVAFRNLQVALIEHIQDMNTRLEAGLAVRETAIGFEVYETEKLVALLRVSLNQENNIHFTQFIKRHNEMQSGTIYLRTSPDGIPSILFSDFPCPNVQVSYQEASKRLLNPSF